MPEVGKPLRPLVLAELNPPMNVTLIKDDAGLEELKTWLEKKKAEETVPIVGLDTETNVVHDFYYRIVRSIQIGDKEKQFVIDLLAYIVSSLEISYEEAEQVLSNAQGHYGKNNGIFKNILDVLEPVVCTNKWLKVGQNLGFEYSVFHWNFGLRIWNLYSTDMAERVIQAGTIPLKKMAEFSMASIVARQFGLKIDKSEQEGFDFKTPLTESQILYAAFDVRMPLSMRQYQINVMTVDQLLTTAQLENDAIGTFTDMHLCGQNLDDERWMRRIKNVIERRQGELKILDEGFIPLVGRKTEQINEEKITKLENIWKNNFEKATPRELELATLKREEKDKEKKALLTKELEEEKKKRATAKAEARTKYSELSKARTKAKKNIEKCEGEAYLNYGSTPQLLEALRKLPGMKNIQDTSDDTLLRFNDRPLIQVLRKFRKGKKDTGTYGIQWTQKWITKPLKAEGWRHPGDGRLHCIFNQLQAETGRTSSEKPNGQNLPQDDEVRACFICDPPDPTVHISTCCDYNTTLLDGKYNCDKCGAFCETKAEEYCIVTIDMSGAELRIIAVLANAKSWIDAFNNGWDVHSVSTEILYPEKWPQLTEAGCAYYAKDENGQPRRQKCKCKGHVELRNGTKATNFLLCYGGGPDALADALGVTLEAAKELMQLHESKFPDVWGYLRISGERAKDLKEARDMFGRRRSFPTPTWQMAKEWFEDEYEDRLELEEEDKDRNIFEFKAKNLREPNEEEEKKLTHRSPTEGEIKQGYRALMGSIGRRGKNHCIQGTNASIIKRAMGCGFSKDGQGYLWHTLIKFKARIQSMVHDELLIHCPKRFGEQVAALAGDAFKRAAAEVMGNIVIMENDYHISHRWQK
jgi:DNA polymerase I-like protein with 3'-5' exonuclease and polymerase domains